MDPGQPPAQVDPRRWAAAHIASAPLPASLPHSALAWPIATSMLPFAAVAPGGTPNREAGPRAWSRVFAEIRAAGFDAVELSTAWMDLGAMSDVELESLRQVLEDEGVRPVALGVVRRSIIHPSDGEENTASTRRVIDAAAALGAHHVALGLHDALTAQQAGNLWFWTEQGVGHREHALREAAITRMQALADHAPAEVSLSVETYDEGLLATADGAVAFIRDVDRDNVGLNPDLGNMIRPQREIESWELLVARLLPYSTYWHIKNYSRVEHTTGLTMSSPSSLASGVIDYRRALQYAVSVGYRGALLCEHYGGDGLSMAAEHQGYLRAVLARIPTGD